MERSIWRKIIQVGSDVLLPQVCAGCGIAGAWICSDCWRYVRPIDLGTCCQRCGHAGGGSQASCPRCAGWPVPTLQLRSRFDLSGPMRTSILRMKYQGEYARAVWHAEQLCELVTEAGWDTADLVVPVPLHTQKLRSRGFNQSQKLAERLANLLDMELSDSLVRQRETQSQTQLRRDDRWTNVASAFSYQTDISGRDILIVDDVATTGATMSGCALALLAARAGRVRGITLASEA